METLRSEFAHYKRMPIASVANDDALHFWLRQHDGPLTLLADFANDLLSIPLSSSEVERSFSRQHKTDTKLAHASSAGNDASEQPC